MIADLKTFIEREKPFWNELERELSRLREGLADLSDLKYSRHVLSLFQRTSSDLVRIEGYSAEPELKAYLEKLVGEGYSEIHSATRESRRFRPWHWFSKTFPQTFRRQRWGFTMAVLVTLVGALLGGALIGLGGQEGREAVYFAFPYLAESTPSERVAGEEDPANEKLKMLAEGRATFSAQLMQNNIGVTFKAMGLGITWGIGTFIVVFMNGIILGGVALDYIADGQIIFLLAWLLPHGSVEIPAILLGAQAGFCLGRAVIGWGTPDALRTRLRKVGPDLVTLCGGAAIFMVWAGLVESFLSQYHAPILPYSIKIAIGVAQLIALFWFLYFCGKEPSKSSAEAA